MIENIVVGELLVHPSELFALDEEDWNDIEKPKTLFTQERFLPRLMVQAGIVSSVSEVRKNNPSLVRELNKIDYEEIKWGKKFLFIAVGK